MFLITVLGVYIGWLQYKKSKKRPKEEHVGQQDASTVSYQVPLVRF